MPTYLEHANLNVADLNGLIHFLCTALPGCRVRHDGIGPDGTRWVHVGTDDYYVALNEGGLIERRDRGFNHLAWVVDDVAGLRERLVAAGFQESGVADQHPHRHRVYFHDPDGREWEFVQYLSAKPSERHDYALPDRFRSLA
jgi:catechol 2,3-dioxygenase-like lactoylglutathione lyase family enzyme